MKKVLICIVIFICNYSISQTLIEEEDTIKTEIALPIWDAENSENVFNVKTLIYDEIPKYLDFRGTMVSGLKWKDLQGENILVFSKSGVFDWKEYDKNDNTKFNFQDKSELFVYLFQKGSGEKRYTKQWRIYDFIDCFGVDMYVGFKQKGTTITDLDKDGIAEISIPYVLFCRGGMDPGIMKIIMYEASEKYAIRGDTAICRGGEILYGGEYKMDEVINESKVLYDFLKILWGTHACE